ncbi:MAG: hypothetical protein IK034_00905 [Bacilli bacterium]|nr:hypothetical protein [Bacilli bacterium]
MSKKTLIAFLVEIALYIIAGLAFYQGFHYFMADVDGFKHILKVGPMFLSCFMLTYLLFAYYYLTHQPNEEKRAKTLKVNGLGFIIGGGLLLVLITVNLILGNYEFGYNSLIFPVDIILMDVVMLALGILITVKKAWVLEKIPVICKEYSKPKWVVIVGRVLGFIYVWVAEYFLAALLMAPTYIDVTTSTFGHTIPLYVLMLFMSLVLFWREFYLAYNKEKEMDKGVVKGITIASLCFATVIGIGVLVTDLLIGHTYYISHNLQCILPIDYMISKNIGPRLLTLCPMIALWFNFIESLAMMAKAKKAKETEPLS